MKGPGTSYNLRIAWDYAYGCPTLVKYEIQRQEPPGTGVWQTFIYEYSPNAVAWTGGPMGVVNDFAMRMRAVHSDGFNTNWSNEIIVQAPVPGDPVVATVTSPEATAYSNGKKIVVDNAGKLHVTYTSGDTIYHTSSTDEGETWPEKTVIGFGSNPAIELLGNGQPSICFLSENQLYRANRLPGGWEPAQCLYQGQKTDHFTYLSYIIDQERDKSYLGWVSTNLSDYSELLILPLDGDTSKATSTPVLLDYSTNPDAFKSPSLALERDGELLAAWSRNGVVRYSVNMGEPEVISAPDKRCIHPIISRLGDRVTAAWQEEVLDNGKGLEPGRYSITARTKTEYGWGEERVIAQGAQGDYQYPVAAAAGQYLYAGHHGDGNYDVHCLGDYSNGWETHVRNITLNSGGQSGYPSAAFSNRWPEHALYILWTEAFTDSSQGKSIEPPLVKAFKDVIQPVPSFEVYPRTDQASTYCTQRAGGLCYGAGAFMTADYHPQELKYRFDRLRPGNRYKVKAVFYQATVTNPEDKAKDWLQMLKCDQTTLGLAHVPKGEAVVLEKEIPSHCLADGIVEIAILRVKGENAVCSGLEIIEYTDGDKADGGGAQSAESELLQAMYRTELLPCAPNPFDRSTNIKYQLAKPGKVSIKVYNTLGQLVRTLEDGERPAGYHSVIWNGKDHSGKMVANGIYLYRMEIGVYGQTRKMTLVR